MRRSKGIAAIIILLAVSGRCATVVDEGCVQSISPERMRTLITHWKSLTIEGLQDLWSSGTARAEVRNADSNDTDVEVRFGHAQGDAICRCCDDFYFSSGDGKRAVLSSVLFIRSFQQREQALDAAEQLWSTLVAPGEIRKNIRTEGLETNIFRLYRRTKSEIGDAPTNIAIWKDGNEYVVSVHLETPQHPVK